MSDVNDTQETITAVLQGGPSDLPESARTRQADGSGDTIKIMHRGGYEHFEPVADAPAGAGTVIYRWTTRTRIAE
jgi:hypothetical protein